MRWHGTHIAPRRLQHGRRAQLLGNQQQAAQAPALADAATARQHRQRHRQHQRQRQRQHPPGRARLAGQRPSHEGGDQAADQAEAGDRLAPAQVVGLARRRFPVELEPGEGAHHEDRVRDHAHRRLQGRQQGFERGARDQPARPAIAGLLAAPQHQQHRQHARHEQQGQGRGPQQGGGEREGRAPHRDRHQCVRFAARHHPWQHTEQHERQPQRRGHVRHRAAHEHGAVHAGNAGLGHQAGVLQVALAPAAVALQLVDQMRRRLLVAALQLGQQPDFVAGAAHQRRLDEVVRHDLAGQAATARQLGQRAVTHEGLHAQDRVVAPVMRLSELPVGQAGREQRAGHAGGELLHACMQRVVAASARRGLDDAGAGLRFHQAHHREQRLAAHHAVGVEHHHVAVGLAPAAAKVGHVAGLAPGAALAPAVVDAHRAGTRGELVAQPAPGGEFGVAQGRVRGVGEQVDVEQAVGRAGIAHRRGERFAGGAQPGAHGGDVFVADRHDDRGARGRIDRPARHRLGTQRMTVAAHQRQVAHHRGHAAGRNPGEQQCEEGGLPLQVSALVAGRRGAQHHRGEDGAARHQQQQQAAPQDGGGDPVAERCRPAAAARRPRTQHRQQRHCQPDQHTGPRRCNHRPAPQGRRRFGAEAVWMVEQADGFHSAGRA